MDGDSVGDRLRQIQQSPERREELREHVGRYLDVPSALLSILILLLIAAQYTSKIERPWHGPLAKLLIALWLVLLLEFAAKLLLAPSKLTYLKRRWHELVYAFVPVVALLRLVRPVGNFLLALFRLFLPESEETRPQIRVLKRRRLGRLVLVSALVALIGAALGFMLEAGAKGSVINNFADALWWSTTTVTTVASQLYPVTAGGQVVGFLLMVYAVAVFSYLASSLASAFIAGDEQRAAGQAQQLQATGQPTSATQAARGDSGGGASDTSRATLELSPQEAALLRSILERLDRMSPERGGAAAPSESAVGDDSSAPH